MTSLETQSKPKESFFVGRVVGSVKILDVVVPEELLTLPYVPEFESRISYKIRCQACRQVSFCASEELMEWKKCLHYQEGHRKPAMRFYKNLHKLPTDNELLQWEAAELRAKRERLNNSDLRKIAKKNPRKFNG